MFDIADYDYSLPDELIAQVPLPDRDKSRLMVVDRSTGSILHQTRLHVEDAWPRKNAVFIAHGHAAESPCRPYGITMADEQLE